MNSIPKYLGGASASQASSASDSILSQSRKYLCGIALALVVGAAAPVLAHAQAPAHHTTSAAFSDVHVGYLGDSLRVTARLSISDLKVPSQDIMVLTPIMVSSDGADTLRLAPIHVIGTTRAKVLSRRALLGYPRTIEGPTPYATMTYARRLEPIAYRQQIPYQAWMDDASLSVEEVVTGCAECRRWALSTSIKDSLFYMPQYHVARVVPAVERRKARADRYAATINFRVNKSDLDINYMGNKAILSEVSDKVAKVVRDEDLTVSKITVVGYASPESSASYNKSLATRRSQAIVDYLIHDHGIPAGMITADGYGEDWVMTRDLIAASTLADKASILAIIDTIPDCDARDIELKKLSGGATYAQMVSEIYPHIRRTEYAFEYTVRGFDVEEAKRVLRVNPKYLSLNEMYLVALTYPQDSKEAQEVFDIALRYFPNDPVALINSACVHVEHGRYADAIRTLTPIARDRRTWNILAVSYAALRDYATAKTYFDSLAGSDDPMIQSNIAEFHKVLQDQGLAL